MPRLRRSFRAACRAACCLAAACGSPGPEIHRFGGPTMGSTYEVKYVGELPVAKVRLVVEKELAQFDAAFSRWREDSEIERINRNPSTEPIPLSRRFQQVLQLALELAEATQGAFDPTVGPLSEIYRRARDDPEHRLDERDLAAARALVDYRGVSIREGALVKARPDVRLDLDGIVAGACVDALAERLDAAGVRAYYLEVTSEVFCRGEKAPGLPWVIGVADPLAAAAGAVDTVAELPLRDRALCTSGDYRNALTAGGRRYHHVFDPRTGRSADRMVVSVTVLADRAAVADGLGTALLVLGEEEGKRLLPGLSRYGTLGALFLVGGTAGALRRATYGWPQER